MRQEYTCTNEETIKIIFSLYGEYFDIEKFSLLVNQEATKKYYKGEKGKYGSYKETSWEYEISTSEYTNKNVNDRLYNFIADNEKIIKDYIEKNNLKTIVSVVFNINNDIVPGLFFDNKLIKILSKIDCSIDIEGYLMD